MKQNELEQTKAEWKGIEDKQTKETEIGAIERKTRIRKEEGRIKMKIRLLCEINYQGSNPHLWPTQEQ